jgi:predicted amidohydrolase
MSLTITLFQTDLIWESKQLNLNHFTEQMSTVAQSDLMVLPEMFSTWVFNAI